MGQTLDQMKMLNQLRKAQKELKNEIVEVEAGDGAVVVQITGELKVKKVTIDPERVDLDDISEGLRGHPVKVLSGIIECEKHAHSRNGDGTGNY